MQERIIPNYITKIGCKQVKVKEYDYPDIINYDNAIGDRKKPYVDTVLRKRIMHITNEIDNHGKKKIIYGMAVKIFFIYIKLIIENLLKGEVIYLEGLGKITLATRPSSSSYENKGRKKDRERSRAFGYYTKIIVSYDNLKSSRDFRYGRPFWVFGSYYKRKLQEIENTGYKF